MNVSILILALNLLAADIPDFGVISPRRGMVLGNRSTRPDFISFRVEILPSTPPTNLITLTVTNDTLTVMDLARVPSGPGVMGVITTFKDGTEADVTLRRYFLARGKPPAASITPTDLLSGPEVERSLTNELRKIRGVNPVPMPPMPTMVPETVPIRVVAPKPLPDGTNRAYADHLDWLADRAAQGKRRNE